MKLKFVSEDTDNGREVHFVKNEIDPIGLGEPPFPPVIGALTNALYKATGKRLYSQPFQPDLGKI